MKSLLWSLLSFCCSLFIFRWCYACLCRQISLQTFYFAHYFPERSLGSFEWQWLGKWSTLISVLLRWKGFCACFQHKLVTPQYMEGLQGTQHKTHPMRATSLQSFFLYHSHLSNSHKPTKGRQGPAGDQPVHYKETFQDPPSSAAWAWGQPDSSTTKQADLVTR